MLQKNVGSRIPIWQLNWKPFTSKDWREYNGKCFIDNNIYF